MKVNDPVIFVYLVRSQRGYYEFRLVKLFDKPASTSEGEISEKHTRALEQIIIEKPENWLWAHKRWKHKRSSNC